MESNGRKDMSEQLNRQFSTDAISRLQSNRLDWQRLMGSPQFDYPIDYSVAVSSVDREAGLIEFIAKWAPNAYCHYHRHLGRTATRVLQGEHHIVETTDLQTSTRLAARAFTDKLRRGNFTWNTAERMVRP
jgi:hypothetical protein